MNLSEFYDQILKSFNENNVEYMVVGGHAVNYYGYVRATLDLDIWINKTKNNLEKLYNCLLQLGYKKENCKIAIKEFEKNHIIKIPKQHDIIELLDSFIMKDDFENAYKNREITKFNNVEYVIIGYNDLLKNKYNSNRTKDLLDAKELKEIEKIIKKSDKNKPK